MAAVLAVFPAPSAPQAQEQADTARLFSEYSGPYKVQEQSDWSRFDNGKYVGHVYREVRALINPAPSVLGTGGSVYSGNFFVMEETLRDMRQSARAVDNVIPVRFELFRDGRIKIEDDRGFPSLRGFPAFPAETVRPGDRWTARGEKSADPLNTGLFIRFPVYAEYIYKGAEIYKEIPVYHITAKYAVRFPTAETSGYRVPSGAFSRLQGTHDVDIMIRISDGLPVMIRDSLDETYAWADGSTVRFRGFTLSAGESYLPRDQGSVIALVKSALDSGGGGSGPGDGRIAGSSGNTIGPGDGIPGSGGSTAASGGKNGAAGSEGTGGAITAPGKESGGQTGRDAAGINIDIQAGDEGIKLTIKDLRFAPDSANILGEERPRLNLLAQALKAADRKMFLVEGHTAAIGFPENEMKLSLERAQTIVKEMVNRGIPADRFIYKGWGGTKPAGSNASEAGRSLNRRVEITILE